MQRSNKILPCPETTKFSPRRKCTRRRVSGPIKQFPVITLNIIVSQLSGKLDFAGRRWSFTSWLVTILKRFQECPEISCLNYYLSELHYPVYTIWRMFDDSWFYRYKSTVRNEFFLLKILFWKQTQRIRMSTRIWGHVPPFNWNAYILAWFPSKLGAPTVENIAGDWVNISLVVNFRGNCWESFRLSATIA